MSGRQIRIESEVGWINHQGKWRKWYIVINNQRVAHAYSRNQARRIRDGLKLLEQKENNE